MTTTPDRGGAATDLVALCERLLRMAHNIDTETDAVERARHAIDVYTLCRAALMPEAATVRRAAVRQLRASGYTLKEVAEALGITDARVAQIQGGK